MFLGLLYILLTAGKLKLLPFAVFFSIDIVVSVKRFLLISLLRQQCQLKIRQQTARALVFKNPSNQSSKTCLYFDNDHIGLMCFAIGFRKGIKSLVYLSKMSTIKVLEAHTPSMS